MDHDKRRTCGPSRGTVTATLAALLLTGYVPTAADRGGEGVKVSPSATDTTLVFEHVTVVDVEHGTLLPDRRVVIVGNRIRSITSAKTGTPPSGAQIVEARDKYLIPGLWDMHVHMFSKSSVSNSLFLANGVTGIRAAGGGRGHSEFLREVLAGTQVGPPRRLFEGASGSANFRKVYTFSFREAAKARRDGVQFGGHVKGIDATVASDSGSRLIDHYSPLSAGGIDTLCSGPLGSVERCRRVSQHLRRNGTWLVPTFAIRYFLFASEVPSRSKPIIARAIAVGRKFESGSKVSGNWLRDSTVDTTAPLRDRLGKHSFPEVRALVSNSVGVLRIAQKVGLPILAGTDDNEGHLADSMGMAAPLGFGIHTELALQVTEGLTPLRSLQTATLNPAKLLDGTDSLGTVAPGKLADLVLLDANPLEDITHTTLIRAVVANGRYFDRTALDSLMAEAQLKVIERQRRKREYLERMRRKRQQDKVNKKP